MSDRTNTPNPTPYSVRTKGEGEFTRKQIYVPSTRTASGEQRYAWIELVDPPTGDPALGLSAHAMLDMVYDPTFLADWKIAYLENAYREFRAEENARKRGDTSYSDWLIEPADSP